jgi:hypothetical protein
MLEEAPVPVLVRTMGRIAASYQLKAAPTAVTQAEPVLITKQNSLLPAPLSLIKRT